MKEGINLRKLRINDLESIMKFFPEKELLMNIGNDIPVNKITKTFEKKWLEKQIKNYKKKKPSEYQLAIDIDRKFAGVIGFNKIDFKNEQGVIGYWIGRLFRGKGYMTRALKILLKNSDKKFKLKRITANVFTYNPASGKVLEKCGFKIEGERRKIKKLDNKFVNDKVYSRIK